MLFNMSEWLVPGSTVVDASTSTSAGNKMGGIAVELKVASASVVAHNLSLLGVGS